MNTETALAELRRRVPGLAGSYVASSDGLPVAQDLPDDLEPAPLAALSAAELSLSRQMVQGVGFGDFTEVVIRGTGGYVVIYAAGAAASLTVLAEPEVNVGRLHLEARPLARAIAEHLAEFLTTSPHISPSGPLHRRNEHVEPGNLAEGDDGHRRRSRVRRR